MYETISKLLEDKKDGYLFQCFDIWHICFLGIIFCAIILTLFLVKNKSELVKKRLLDLTVGFAFGLYMADFFLMPFAFGEIHIEKLPFHACTLTCVLCFLSRHSAFFGRFKKSFTVIGLISNFIFAVYPAGVMWYQVHPLSYRAVQTLLFHGVMAAYGIFALAFDKDITLDWKKIFKQDLIVLVLMILWALLGCYSYTGSYNGYNQWHNWFFVQTDPFQILPPTVAPFATLFAFLLADAVVHLIYFAIKKSGKKNKN